MPILTPKQLQVLKLAALTNRQAALMLGLNYQTIKHHYWSEINDRLGSTCKTDAVIVALRLGIVDLDDFVRIERVQKDT